MVLIAAAVCTKTGKAMVSRQFVEMTKARIEGLLAAFPKLMSTGKQHTFVETESVRYVYQPLEKLYMLLITTKASNILEDLETLRLFSRVIVALGYRESVNLAQIRTFVEMESHEEKVYQAVRLTQEREAKNKMREKAKELQRQHMEATKKGGMKGMAYGGSGGFGVGSASSGTFSSPVVCDSMETPVKPSYPSSIQKTAANTKAMKLGSKTRDVESFVDQLKSEGEQERLLVSIGRDGGLRSFELHGLVTLRISNENFGRIRVVLENKDTRGIQLQTHPNVDKDLFRTKGEIGLKNPSKPFPMHTDVGVLKWRLQTQDESFVPLSINCWPSENGQGGCDVNIEFELEHENLELNDLNITIPLQETTDTTQGNPSYSGQFPSSTTTQSLEHSSSPPLEHQPTSSPSQCHLLRENPTQTSRSLKSCKWTMSLQ
ncbi:hypothetical protein B566_EDAN010821 [Ephemera danica]|nr:hypothetical protein B566_EDAN010821 [Ephemera danica]